MAISEITNSQAIDTTEWSMATDTAYDTGDAQTDAGVVQAFIDASDMVAGDQLRLLVYEKVAGAGDTQRVVYQATLTGAQAEPVFVTPALTLMHGWDITGAALAGTIAVGWSIRRVPVA